MLQEQRGRCQGGQGWHQGETSASRASLCGSSRLHLLGSFPPPKERGRREGRAAEAKEEEEEEEEAEAEEEEEEAEAEAEAEEEGWHQGETSASRASHCGSSRLHLLGSFPPPKERGRREGRVEGVDASLPYLFAAS